MRIAFLLTSLNPGGIGTFTKYMLEALTAQGVKCDVILTLGAGEMVSQVEHMGIPLHFCLQHWQTQLSWSYRVGKLMRQSAGLTFGLRLTALLRRIKPDIVHSQVHGDNWTKQMLASHFAGAPFLMQVGSPSSVYPTSWTGRNLFPRVFSDCDRVVAVSSDTFSAYSKLLNSLGEQAKVIHYCLPDPGQPSFDIRQRIRADLGIPDDTFVVGSIGRLIASKRYNDVLEAIRHVILAGYKVHLVLVGDGSERAALEAQTEKLGIQSQVHFTGFQTNPHYWLNALDIFVTASLFEGFPVAVIEAMAATLPIIATNVVGIREVVAKPNTAILVPPQNPQVIASAIIELIQSPDKLQLLRQTARAEFLQRFQMSGCIESYQTLYNEMLQTRDAKV